MITSSPELDNAIVAGVSSLVTIGAAALKTWYADYRRQKSANAVTDHAQVYRALSQLSATLHADRALILFSSNGGGIPTVGKPLYTSILYEVFGGNSIEPIQDNFQRTLLDKAYINVLSKVVENKVWIGTPKDLETGFLKSLYEIEGVEHSMIFEIARTESYYYYASVRWNTKTRPNNGALDLARIEFISKVSEILKKK